MAAHQAPLSMGFSRQEHWSGLPFPPPMHASESQSEVPQSCPTLSDAMDCSLPGSSVHGIFQARVLEWGAIAFSKLRHSNVGKKFVLFSSLRTPNPISTWRAPNCSLVLGDARLLINLPGNWHTQRSLIFRWNTCQLLIWVWLFCNSVDYTKGKFFLKARILKWFATPSPVDHILSLMTNLDSISNSRDIPLATKVHLVKAMVFPEVKYGCDS